MKLSLPQLMLAATLLACGIFGAPVKATESYTWYFTRHAEKSAEKIDPALSERGQQRAQQLATQLAGSSIMAIYSTDYQRTQQTAKPLAQALGITVSRYAAGEPEALLKRLQQAQQTSLIVGHSNTIPALVRLAGGKAEDLSEQDYGDVFVVEMQQGNVINAYQLRVELP